MRDPWEYTKIFGEENRKQNEFVKKYMLEHFGEKPKDMALANSDALKAYYKSQGFTFGSDEETFIYPDWLLKSQEGL